MKRESAAGHVVKDGVPCLKKGLAFPVHRRTTRKCDDSSRLEVSGLEGREADTTEGTDRA